MYRLAAFTLSATLALNAFATKPQVEMKTNLGTITIELDPAAAPATVENFLGYVKSGFFEGTIFHRVMKGFMAQGGGFDAKMNQKPAREPVKNEAEMALKAGLKNDRGTIAMARTPNPHSATAQFFINYSNNASLNFPGADGWGYTVFGKVTAGMDVVDKMANIPGTRVGPHANVPAETITIEKVTLKK